MTINNMTYRCDVDGVFLYCSCGFYVDRFIPNMQPTTAEVAINHLATCEGVVTVMSNCEPYGEETTEIVLKSVYYNPETEQGSEEASPGNILKTEIYDLKLQIVEKDNKIRELTNLYSVMKDNLYDEMNRNARSFEYKKRCGFTEGDKVKDKITNKEYIIVDFNGDNWAYCHDGRAKDRKTTLKLMPPTVFEKVNKGIGSQLETWLLILMPSIFIIGLACLFYTYGI